MKATMVTMDTALFLHMATASLCVNLGPSKHPATTNVWMNAGGLNEEAATVRVG